jgi:hypothetical protein
MSETAQILESITHLQTRRRSRSKHQTTLGVLGWTCTILLLEVASRHSETRASFGSPLDGSVLQNAARIFDFVDS